MIASAIWKNLPVPKDIRSLDGAAERETDAERFTGVRKSCLFSPNPKPPRR